MAKAKAGESSPSVVRVNERVFVMPAGHLQGFAAAWASGREAGAVSLQDVGSVADLNPNDPRDTGYAGVLPNSYGRASPSRLYRLYREDGTFARVVDQVAEDTWGEGWTLATKDEAWARQAHEIDERLEVRSELELADKWHLIGGLSLLYMYLDGANADPWREPKGVVDVFRVKAIPRTRIRDAHAEDDPARERFDRVRAYVLNKPDGGQATVHWMRILELRQFPRHDSDWDGISLGSRIHDDVRMKRNIEWAAVTAYGQRSAPLLVVKVKEGAKPTQKDIDDIADETKLLQAHVIQSIIARNFDVEAITGTAQLPDPMKWWLMAIRSLAVTTGIPAHVIAGMATGELASSQEDTRRWNGRVSRRQENFASPILRQWYSRLAEWGLLGPVPGDLEIRWADLGEPTAKEAMEIEQARAAAVQGYRNAGVQPPQQLVDYTPAEAPLSAQQPPAPRAAPGFPAAEAARCCGREEADEATLPPGKRVMVAGVRRVEQAVEAAVRDAIMAFFDAWRPKLADHVRAHAGREDDRPGAKLQVDLGRSLKDAVLRAYQEAARLGAGDAARQAGRGQDDVRDALDRSGIAYFRTTSRLNGVEAARRITSDIRDVVAAGVKAGEDFQVIAGRVQARFAELAEHEAQRIARTEAMTAYNAGHEAAMKALGVEEFEFIAYPGADYGDPDGPCVVRDGRRFKVGDEDNTPPLHPNDRCTMRPVIPEAEA